MSFFTREIKTETVAVRSFQSLDEIKLLGDLFKAQYRNYFELPDGSILPGESRPVDRSVELTKGDAIDFNGTVISLTDFIAIAALFAEKYRVEDESKVGPPPGGIGVIGVVTPP